MRKRLSNIESAATEQSQIQLQQIDEYMKIAKNESNSTQLRQNAINKLNQEVKEFNGTLTLQNLESQATAIALDKYKNAIINSAKAAAAKAEIEAMVVEQTELRKSVQKVTKAFLEYDKQGVPTTRSLQKVRNMTQDARDTIKELDTQMDSLAKTTALLTLGNGDAEKAITLLEVTQKSYADSVAGLRQKIADLTTVRNNAIEGSDDFTTSTKLLAEAQKDLNKILDTGKNTAKTRQQIDAMSEKTLSEIAKKKTELNKLLKEEVINSDEYKPIQAEIVRLDAEKAKGDIVTVVNKETLIEKLQKEIDEQKALLEVLGNSAVVSAEKDAAEITMLKKQIELIIAKKQANQELSADDLIAIEALKNRIAEITQTVGEGEDNVMVKLFGGGEAGATAFNNTMTSLNSINGLIAARANMQNKETEERIKNITAEEKQQITSLRNTTRYKNMTEQQQADAEKKISEKAEADRLVFEKAAFERNKKTAKQMAILSGAQAVMKIAAQYPYPFSLIPIAAQVIMTKMELATIEKSTFALGGLIEQYAKGGELARGGVFKGKSHAQGGIKFHTGGRLMEAEGGEAIINKQSTAMFRNELSAINQAGGGVKFADGGLTRGLDGMVQTALQSSLTDDDVDRISLALNTQEVVVTEQQISSTQRQVNVLEQRMSF